MRYCEIFQQERSLYHDLTPTFIKNDSKPFDVKDDAVTPIHTRCNCMISGQDNFTVQILSYIRVSAFTVVLENPYRLVQVTKRKKRVKFIPISIFGEQSTDTDVSISFSHEFMMTTMVH